MVLAGLSHLSNLYLSFIISSLFYSFQFFCPSYSEEVFFSCIFCRLKAVPCKVLILFFGVGASIFSSIFSFKISLVQFICIIQQFKSCFGKVFLDSCPIFCLAKNISMCLAKRTMIYLGRRSKNKAIIEQYFFFVKSSIMH